MSTDSNETAASKLSDTDMKNAVLMNTKDVKDTKEELGMLSNVTGVYAIAMIVWVAWICWGMPGCRKEEEEESDRGRYSAEILRQRERDRIYDSGMDTGDSNGYERGKKEGKQEQLETMPGYKQVKNEAYLRGYHEAIARFERQLKDKQIASGPDVIAIKSDLLMSVEDPKKYKEAMLRDIIIRCKAYRVTGRANTQEYKDLLKLIKSIEDSDIEIGETPD